MCSNVAQLFDIIFNEVKSMAGFLVSDFQIMSFHYKFKVDSCLAWVDVFEYLGNYFKLGDLGIIYRVRKCQTTVFIN